MAFIHPQSCECTKSELDVFAVPGTQTAIEYATVLEYSPVSAIAHMLPIEFNVSGSGDSYIDMNNTQLYVRAKITRANGDAIDQTDQVAPVNLTMHSLFSEVDLKLNDTLVTSTNSTYPYRAYLETLLSFSPDTKSSQLTSSLYYKDTASHMDETDPGGNNTGLQKRHSFFRNGAVCDMTGQLHLDLCFQDRFIPSDVGLKLRLIRNKDAFCLMAAGGAPAYKLVIVDCKLYVRKVKLSPSVFLAHANALEKATMKFPIRRVVTKAFSVPTGNMDFNQENLFTGQLPTRLVVGFLENTAFNGSYAHNPFNFKHYNINQLKLYTDGQLQNTLRPLEPDFANNLYIREYMALYEGLCKMGRDEGLDIAREEYGSGYTIFVWDLTPDQSEGDHFNLSRDGTIRLEGKFSQALPSTISIMCYAEFQNILEIDRSKNVIYDYAN
jgi:hypothetical protein